MTEISQRFSFDPVSKQIIVNVGKVEIGQHVHSGFQKIIADSLEIEIAHVRVSPVTTQFSPNDGMTVGSQSMQITGTALCNAARTLRTTLIHEASQRLRSPVDDINLDTDTLEFFAQHRRCSIFDLPTAKDAVVTKNENECDWVSSATIGASIRGERVYIQDIVLPEMVHARALRGRNIILEGTDNVRVIKDSGFTALVAETVVALDQAWARIETETTARDATCDGPVNNWIQQRHAQTQTTGDTSAIQGPVLQSATRPFLLHASIAPSCAIARFKRGILEIWTHSQGIFPLRETVAHHLGMRIEDIIVRHVPSAGCYGHSAADDAAMDAVLVSFQTEGVPVRVAWTRQDDFLHSPVGAAMHVQIKAQLSDDNSIKSWRQTIWSCPHAQRPGSAGNINLLAAIEQSSNNKSTIVADLPDAIGGGASRNATPPYSIKSLGVTSHIVQNLPVRTSSIRGLGAQMNVVCIESAMDTLARSCEADPLEFRLKHLEDPRACEVLRRLRAELEAASVSLQEDESIGIAYSRYKGKAAYAAVAARIRLTTRVELVDVWAVVDAGQIVDRSGALNQIEGGIIQATSWTLCEGTLLRDGYIDAVSWDDYPILAWSDVPDIHTTLVNERVELPYLGVGECMVGPVSAAIVNGVSNVAGCSMADLPLTHEKFLQAAAVREQA